MTPTEYTECAWRVSEGLWPKAGELLKMEQNRMTDFICLIEPKLGYTVKDGVKLFWKYARSGKQRHPEWAPTVGVAEKDGKPRFANKNVGRAYGVVMPNCDPADAALMEKSFAAHVLNTRRYRAMAKGERLANRGGHQCRGGAWLDGFRDFIGDECIFFPGAVIYRPQDVKYNYATMKAARAMLIKTQGQPPRGKTHAAHKCGMGHMSCVNPRHLYWATARENAMDATQHNAKRIQLEDVTRQDAERIKEMTGLTNVIAWETGISSVAVSAIKLGRIYA